MLLHVIISSARCLCTFHSFSFTPTPHGLLPGATFRGSVFGDGGWLLARTSLQPGTKPVSWTALSIALEARCIAAVGLAPWLSRLPAALNCKPSVLYWYRILVFRTLRARWVSESGTEGKMNEFGFKLWLWLEFCMLGFSRLLYPIMSDKGSISHLLLASTVVSFTWIIKSYKVLKSII